MAGRRRETVDLEGVPSIPDGVAEVIAEEGDEFLTPLEISVCDELIRSARREIRRRYVEENTNGHNEDVEVWQSDASACEG